MQRYLALLKQNPHYTRLWLSQVISMMGDWFNTVVLFALVASYSPGREGLAVSIFVLCRVLPPMLISPVAGVLVDRFDRKRLLIWSNFLRGIVVLGLLVATERPDLLWLVYALTIVQFTISSVFEPGQSALIPNLVAPQDLIPANTLVNITWSAMLALGAVIGGVVATVFGTQIALICDALSFVIAGWLILPIKPRPIERLPDHQHDTSFREGVRYLRRTPRAAMLLLGKAGISLGNVDTLLAIYATQIFVIGQDGQFSLGIMYSVFGIGAIAGPLLFNRVNDGSVARMRRLMGIAFAATVLGWLVLGIAGSLVILCVGLFVRAICGSVNWTYSTISLQKTVPDAYMGRVFSVDMAGYYLSTVVSTIVHGSLIDLVGSQHVQWIALGTGLVALIPALVWALLVRQTEARERVGIGAENHA